jgi:putative transcriptional regulator
VYGKQGISERTDPVPKSGSETLLGGMIEVHLHELLAARGMTLAALSERVGVTIVNLSVLKNGHARAIRFSTLAKLCGVLDCQPGDLLSWREDLEGAPDQARNRSPRGVGRNPADSSACASGES